MGSNFTRWLIPLPAILFAVAPQNANAESTYNTWTCYQSNTNQWTMQQPLADYQAGLMPNWNDCLAWQNGEPENYVWSYGPSVTTTTTTTTTIQETTTSWVQSTTSTTAVTTSTTIAETTTVPATTTTVVPSTTTTTTIEPVQTSTTTSTTSTTVAPTTTTEPPYTPPQTSTTVPEPELESSPTNETQPEETTNEPATTIDETKTTEPETSTTYPDETFVEPVEPDETTIPKTFFPEIPDEPVLDETEQSTEPLEPEEDISETTQLAVQSSSTTSVLFLKDELIDDEQFSAIIESIDEATPEQIVVIIETVLAANVTSEQAAELVSNVAVLQVITESEAKELFSEVVPAELSEEQAALIVGAVQSAPKEVRKAFEAVIDIFGSQFESYVPTGSNIPVSERRTLVAIGATLTMLPAPRVRR